MNPNLKGNIAEAAIAFRALRAGIEVLRPQGEHVRYDLAFDIGGRIYRVQCKSGTRKGEAVVVRLVSSRRCADGYHRTFYSRTDVDLIAAYCDELDSCYLLPIEEVEGMTAFQLRLSPARNGQQVCINLAADYDFEGAVAQLEERVHGMHEVRGSSPLSSTSKSAETECLGADEFGKAYARFLQRAASGEEFLISRRGRPMARLSPVDNDTPPG